MTRQSTLFLLMLFLFSLGSEKASAQWGVGQEIGVVAGPLAFFSDYGLRYNMETNTGNTGWGVGLVHYMNFAYRADCNCYTTDTYFNDHFKIRSEIDYHQTQLRHFGELVSKYDELSGMIGSSTVTEIGAHLEWHPFSIRDYTAYAYPFVPFFSLGANFVAFKPTARSTLGPLEENLFHAFEGGVNVESSSTWSIVGGAGARYRLGNSNDIVANAQWRYYFTDFLDGLGHEAPQNKFNDVIFWLNIGYIYYINF